jgi:hypothetical protein
MVPRNCPEPPVFHKKIPCYVQRARLFRPDYWASAAADNLSKSTAVPRPILKAEHFCDPLACFGMENRVSGYLY